MSNAIQSIRDVMSADARALDVIAQNVANIETTGYQRLLLAQQSTFAEGGGSHESAPDHANAPHRVDRTPGSLRATGIATHLALSSEGDFVLQGPNGPEATRRGDFHIGQDGLLVSHRGFPVLGERGPIEVGSGTLVVKTDGEILVDGRSTDRLLVIDRQGDVVAGTSPHGDETPLGLTQANHPVVQQGFLEASNVSAVDEMIELMRVLRHFETAQRFARGADDMLSTAISTLGKL